MNEPPPHYKAPSSEETLISFLEATIDVLKRGARVQATNPMFSARMHESGGVERVQFDIWFERPEAMSVKRVG